jgi:hypothetical protein
VGRALDIVHWPKLASKLPGDCAAFQSAGGFQANRMGKHASLAGVDQLNNASHLHGPSPEAFEVVGIIDTIWENNEPWRGSLGAAVC